MVQHLFCRDKLPHECVARQPQEAERRKQERVQMSAILKRIGDKDTSQAGLEELFRFKQQHPDADLNAYFALMSSEFRMYLQRGLEKAAKRAGEPSFPPSAVRP